MIKREGVKGLVSVILPVYNVADTLDAAIESILNQTYENWQLVICDDCSTDGSYDIALGYKEKYPDKIVVLRNEKNMKIATTLNNCLDEAKGEFIARMDGDDTCVPERLAVQVAFLQEHPDYKVCDSSYVVFDEDGTHGMRRGNAVYKNGMGSYFYWHPTVMARREMYEILDGYSTDKVITRCEDVDLWFRFTKAGMIGGRIDQPLYWHRESAHDYKKRTVKNGWNCTKVMIRGCKMLGTPKSKWVYALQPTISAMIPTFLMKKYHEIKDKKAENRK